MIVIEVASACASCGREAIVWTWIRLVSVPHLHSLTWHIFASTKQNATLNYQRTIMYAACFGLWLWFAELVSIRRHRSASAIGKRCALSTLQEDTPFVRHTTISFRISDSVRQTDCRFLCCFCCISLPLCLMHGLGPCDHRRMRCARPRECDVSTKSIPQNSRMGQSELWSHKTTLTQVHFATLFMLRVSETVHLRPKQYSNAYTFMRLSSLAK